VRNNTILNCPEPEMDSNNEELNELCLGAVRELRTGSETRTAARAGSASALFVARSFGFYVTNSCVF
jgi:hypothetical protein